MCATRGEVSDRADQGQDDEPHQRDWEPPPSEDDAPEPDKVDIASRDSFPCSDPPGY